MLQDFVTDFILKQKNKKISCIAAVSIQSNPPPPCPACPLISRFLVYPRSHKHGSWFLLRHVNALSGSSPASHCGQNSEAKGADAAPCRNWSVGPARKGHQCGQRPPRNTASDWTRASLATTWRNWPPRQS